MAVRDTGRKHPSTLSCFAALIIFSLILIFTTHRSSLSSSIHLAATLPDGRCNYSAGAWIRQQDPVTARYDSTCKEIFKGWNCIASGKLHALDLLQWRWHPVGCHLPPLDPLSFLNRYRNINIGFIGDSLNRNMFVSLVCMLRRVAGEVRKWRPAGADRGFTFVRYNLTVAYHRTNLLVRYGGLLVKLEVR